MTAQIAEKLHYDGQELSLCENPLDDYFELAGARPRFAQTCTALWRGYVGTWEIVDGRLYLVGIQGVLEDGTEVTLESLFPGFPDRVFAHWYSGTMRVPQGKLLQYRHMGYGSTYEYDLFIEVERGVVQSTRVQHNGVATDPDAAQGYEVAAMTVFPLEKQRGADE